MAQNYFGGIFDKPYNGENPWALNVIRTHKGVLQGERIHRDNLLHLARRCIEKRDWKNAATIAMQLVRMVEKYKDQRKRKRSRRTPSSLFKEHSQNTLVEVWRTVLEIGLHFPEDFSFKQLSKFSRQIYRLIPERDRKHVISAIVDLHLVHDDPARTFLEIQQLGGSSRTLRHTLVLGLVQYQRWAATLKTRPDQVHVEDLLVSMLEISEPVGGEGGRGEGDSGLREAHRMWTKATLDLHHQAKHLLSRYFEPEALSQPLGFRMVCDVVSRLVHLHAADNTLDRVHAAIKHRRGRQSGRNQLEGGPFLAQMDLLLCLIHEDDDTFDALLSLSQEDPTSPALLKALDLVRRKIRSLEDHGIPEGATWNKDRLRQWRNQARTTGLRVLFSLLDQAPHSEDAWTLLRTMIGEEGEEGKELVADLVKERRWWVRDRRRRGRLEGLPFEVPSTPCPNLWELEIRPVTISLNLK